MGLTYGKMPVPPKELCVSAGGAKAKVGGVNLPRERSSSQWNFGFGEAFYFEQKGYFIYKFHVHKYIYIYSSPAACFCSQKSEFCLDSLTKHLCLLLAGPGFNMTTLGGQGLAAWRPTSGFSAAGWGMALWNGIWLPWKVGICPGPVSPGTFFFLQKTNAAQRDFEEAKELTQKRWECQHFASFKKAAHLHKDSEMQKLCGTFGQRPRWPHGSAKGLQPTDLQIFQQMCLMSKAERIKR